MTGVGLKQILAAKRVVRKAAARHAARKYTWVWDQVIQEAQGIHPKSKKIPPGFIGTNKQKFSRALLYKNRIINHAIRNPQRYGTYIYRGVRGTESNQFRRNTEVHKNILSSFSKSFNVARGFAGYDGVVLYLNTAYNKIPSLNFTRNFQSEFSPGGKRYTGRNEREVLLPPGTFKVKNSYIAHNGTNIRIVNFVPNKINTSYLHVQKQSLHPKRRRAVTPSVLHSVNSKGKSIFKGSKGGLFKLSSSGKKKYLSMGSVH